MNSSFFRNKEGKPVFLAGLQCHNSSSGTEMVDTSIEAVKLHGGNLLEAPVYWCSLEPEEDSYDMRLAKELIDKAGKAGLYLILLWFGASKNGMGTYAPEYVKTNPEKYRYAQNYAGIPVESFSPHVKAVWERDKKAFVKLVEFIAEYDRQGTVIAIQVENEMGLVATDRDYSREAQMEYEQLVPENLREIRIKDSGSVYETEGGAPTWKNVFGRYGAEAFTAWKHAALVQEMVEAVSGKLQIPYFMNVSIELNDYQEAGLCYIAGGPVSTMMDIWKKTAPGISLFGPDIYLGAEREFREACARYAREDNPLFIPESNQSGMGEALNLFLAVADYNAVGICTFGVESGISDGRLLPETACVAESMRAITAVAPLLIQYHNTGRIYSMTQTEFSERQYIKTKDYHVTASFISANPGLQHYYGSRINVNAPENEGFLTKRGRGLLIDCGDGEFYASGMGICLKFIKRPETMDENAYAHLTGQTATHLHFLSIEEGHFEGEKWVCEYQRNGDEANYQVYLHEGQVLRIRLNTRNGF